ncbi:MAG: hypothetical protein V1866_03740 [archaeon]
MKKALVLMIAILAIVMIAGCAKVAEKSAEQKLEAQIEKETGSDANVDLGKGSIQVTTDEGKIEATGVGDGKSWCQEGAEWKFTSSNPAEQANVKWDIKGLVASGEYSGLCHVEYTVVSEGQTNKIDYYFSQDGKSGYFEMDAGGQKIKQEWKSQ